eukprot:COSAG01_NODE_3710_length_5770_cov_10.433962_5_plen_70_part_00
MCVARSGGQSAPTLRIFIVRTIAASIACLRSSFTTLSASPRSFSFIASVLIIGNLIRAFLRTPDAQSFS